MFRYPPKKNVNQILSDALRLLLHISSRNYQHRIQGREKVCAKVPFCTIFTQINNTVLELKP